jgi:hypothetical protein
LDERRKSCFPRGICGLDDDGKRVASVKEVASGRHPYPA